MISHSSDRRPDIYVLHFAHQGDPPIEHSFAIADEPAVAGRPVKTPFGGNQSVEYGRTLQIRLAERLAAHRVDRQQFAARAAEVARRKAAR